MTEMLSCRIGTHDLAIPVAEIQQIVKTPAMTLLAHHKGTITGVFSLRGRIVACIDPAMDGNTKEFCIVVAYDGDLYAIPVSTVGDVVDITDDVQPIPLTYPAAIRRLASQIVTYKSCVMGVVDVPSILSPEKKDESLMSCG
jgi:chemotaxis signal transduction protein